MSNKVKKNFVLRIDADIYAAIEKWAVDEFRSVNGQIEYLLDKVLTDTKRIKKTKNDNKQNSHD